MSIPPEPLSEPMTPADRLAPCPFCGIVPEVFPGGEGGTGTMVECVTPGCVNPHVSYYGDGVAVAKWNRRVVSPTDPPNERATLEALWNGDITLTVEERRWIRQALNVQGPTDPDLRAALQDVVNRATQRLMWFDQQPKATRETAAPCETTLSNIVERARAALQDSRPNDAHPEAFCQQCRRRNVVWFAPSEVWNLVYPREAIVCPVCFIQAAEAAGIVTSWRVAPEHVNSAAFRADRVVRGAASPPEGAQP